MERVIVSLVLAVGLISVGLVIGVMIAPRAETPTSAWWEAVGATGQWMGAVASGIAVWVAVLTAQQSHKLAQRTERNEAQRRMRRLGAALSEISQELLTNAHSIKEIAEHPFDRDCFAAHLASLGFLRSKYLDDWTEYAEECTHEVWDALQKSKGFVELMRATEPHARSMLGKPMDEAAKTLWEGFAEGAKIAHPVIADAREKLENWASQRSGIPRPPEASGT